MSLGFSEVSNEILIYTLQRQNEILMSIVAFVGAILGVSIFRQLRK
jgi:hypothetical protein